MRWNWEQQDWPNFLWDADKLAPLERQFVHLAGVQQGVFKHTPEADRIPLLIGLMTDEALTTSEIEGEYLNRDSVQASLLRQFGMEADNRRIPPAERGISELLFDLYRHRAVLLDETRLHRWHRLVMAGRGDVDQVGAWRSGGDPMQVVSGPIHKPKVHFEAPPSQHMAREMAHFLDWFGTTGQGGSAALSALTRSGLAHLYFVAIHPYEDGNGRIARALAELVIAQAFGQPSLLALSKTINANRKKYYNALERNNKNLEVTDWLLYFGQTVIDAQLQSIAEIEFLIAKTRLFDRLQGQINMRQSAALSRMFREGPTGFKGGLSAANYITITGASRATATRDLAQLVELGALSMRGSLKSTRYDFKLGSPEGAKVKKGVE
jgi:Fic family protein